MRDIGVRDADGLAWGIAVVDGDATESLGNRRVRSRRPSCMYVVVVNERQWSDLNARLDRIEAMLATLTEGQS